MTDVTPRYWAFISYSHRDARIAAALQRALETYRLPKTVVGTATAMGVVPATVKPIFRDRDELQASTDLKAVVRDALAHSRFLIVVCSPDAARSAWVNQEIVEFKKIHGESRVLAVIARGEPFASRRSGSEAEECFPEALRVALVPDGADALEPIAADLRSHGDGRRRATLKLIAGMVGVGADQLIRRDAKRRIRQLALVAAASALGMAAMTVLAINAMRARNEAQAQRAQAEDLLEFMLGDLRKKLDPVGRLEVLDGVGEKVVAYYAQQDADLLDANSLGRRSRAFHLLGEIREQRAQLESAETAFKQAANTTAQLLARAPADPPRIFDHAQSVYWVGHLAWLRGQPATAEKEFRRYVELADRLVQLDPGKPAWQAETAYARVNVGVVCTDTARFDEALECFDQARTTMQQLMIAQPSRALDLANCLGWIARVQALRGDLEHAVASHEAKMRLLEAMPDAATNQLIKRQLRVIYGELARLNLALGRLPAAEQFALAGVAAAKALVAVDPRNNTWLEQQYASQLVLAEVQLTSGNRTTARENSQEALAGSAKLLSLDPKMIGWQVNLRGVALCIAAQLAREDERPALIDGLTDYLVKVRPYSSSGPGKNQARDVVIAKAEWQLGLLLTAQGRAAEAPSHWRAAATWLQPYAETKDFNVLTILALAKLQLGAIAETRELARRLEASPYRHPAYAELVQQIADRAGSASVP